MVRASRLHTREYYVRMHTPNSSSSMHTYFRNRVLALVQQYTRAHLTCNMYVCMTCRYFLFIYAVCIILCICTCYSRVCIILLCILASTKIICILCILASTKIICMHTLVRAVDRSTAFTPSLRHPLSHFRVSPFLKDTVQKDSTCPRQHYSQSRHHTFRALSPTQDNNNGCR